MKATRVAIIGIGGFGKQHVGMISKLAREERVQAVAFAELRPEAHPESVKRLTELGAVHYTDYVQMLKEHPEVDFVVVSTPIAAHKPMCIQVMRMGFHVLVEKPPAITIQDIDEMIAAQRETGKLCQVDFQNTSGQAFRRLLERLNAGAIGKVTHVTGVGMWKRTQAYYDRTRWAGKLVDNGSYVLDGTFNNPLAHLLHNCLLAAGLESDPGLLPVSVQAELYHVNPIEGDDVSCIRAVMGNEAVVHFYAMLSHETNEVPSISVYGTEGEAHWNYQNKLTIRGRDGEESVAFGQAELMRNMYMNLIQAIHGGDEPLYAPIEACRSFVLTSNGAYESSRVIRPIPSTYVNTQPDEETIVRLLPELSARMQETAAKRLLYSEAGFGWATSTSVFSLQGYNRFELPDTMVTGERVVQS